MKHPVTALMGLAVGACLFSTADLYANTVPVPRIKVVPAELAKTDKPSLPEETVLLMDGLTKLQDREYQDAMKIRLRLKPGSAERMALAWALVTSNRPDIPLTTITRIAEDLDSWPSQKAIRRNYEWAFLKEQPSAGAIVSEFERNRPESDLAVTALATAYLKTGDDKAAARVIRTWWPNARLSVKEQAKFAVRFSSLLRPSDHKRRMDRLFYDDKVNLALRLSALAKAESLAKGRAAVVNNRSNASRSLKKVHESWNGDPGLKFSKILLARRKGDYETAARLIESSSADSDKLIDPDRWWVERRIVSRELLERGEIRRAYDLASGHSSTGRVAIADAEFHAGWFALRFLKEPKRAEAHFETLVAIVQTPISKARALYWLGRVAEADNRPGDASARFEDAARYPGTFYGQLAHERLGLKSLNIRQTETTNEDRKALAANPVVRAIRAFEQAGDDRRAGILYRHLAQTLASSAQLGLLARRLEQRGDHHAALNIGKVAYNGGAQVEHLAFPIGAIPDEKSLSSYDLAMIYAIARQESGFRADAVSSAGALGLLQVMPKTAKAIAKRKDLPFSKNALIEDPRLNAAIGAAYFQEQLLRWDGSYVLTLAAYNAGPNRLKSWIERFGDPRGKTTDEIVDWIESIPFPETRNYVMRVLEGYQVYQTRISNQTLRLAEDLAAGG